MWTLTIKGWNQLPDLLCVLKETKHLYDWLWPTCVEKLSVFTSLHVRFTCHKSADLPVRNIWPPRRRKRCCPPLKHSHQLEQWVICSVHRALRARETWHNFIQPNCNLIVFIQIRWTLCCSIHHADTQISQHDTWVSDETAYKPELSGWCLTNTTRFITAVSNWKRATKHAAWDAITDGSSARDQKYHQNSPRTVGPVSSLR